MDMLMFNHICLLLRERDDRLLRIKTEKTIAYRPDLPQRFLRVRYHCLFVYSVPVYVPRCTHLDSDIIERQSIIQTRNSIIDFVIKSCRWACRFQTDGEMSARFADHSRFRWNDFSFILEQTNWRSGMRTR